MARENWSGVSGKGIKDNILNGDGELVTGIREGQQAYA